MENKDGISECSYKQFQDALMKNKKLEILKLCGFKCRLRFFVLVMCPETSVLSSVENCI